MKYEILPEFASHDQTNTYMANIWQDVCKTKKMQRTYDKLPNSQEKSKLNSFIFSQFVREFQFNELKGNERLII